MIVPDVADIFAATEATWPAAARRTLGPFTLRDGQGGGSRVSAATVAPGTDAATIAAHLPDAEAAMTAMGQPLLFQVREGADAPDAVLDAVLADAGYAVMDPVVGYLCPTATLAAEPLEMLRTFRVWPPVAAQREIWAAGGIGPARLAVMARAAAPCTALLGRSGDTPAASAFVACHDEGTRRLAMLHALETAPAFRRRGLGRHMMRAAGHWAAAQGAAHLALLVTRANIGANALYRGLGMVPAAAYHYRIRRKG